MRIKNCVPHRLPLSKLDWGRIVPFLGIAREALGRYDETLKKSPPDLFELFKWQESVSSLRGQNIEADVEEAFQFATERSNEETRHPLLEKIVHAQEGLEWAIRQGRNQTFGDPFFCKLHAIVKQDAPNPKEIGRFRKRQNWIGPQGRPIEEAYFFPPQAKKVKRCMSSLHRYMKKKDKDPLVQLAIFFAQFLIIHPFMDGNGRVVRIFIPLFLWKKRLLSQPLFFLSRYFEDHRLEYFRKLFNISEKNAWENWIVYFLKGVAEQSLRLQEQAEKFQELYRKLSAELGEKKAVELFKKPIQSKRKGLVLFEPLFKIIR
jgi:cell filamentation protein, protein adenylyltransferase